LESALDWACLEQPSHRRITTGTDILITGIRMATLATTVTHTPMATATPTADTMRGPMDGDGGITGGTTTTGTTISSRLMSFPRVRWPRNVSRSRGRFVRQRSTPAMYRPDRG
jgi:hypothetical protein